MGGLILYRHGDCLLKKRDGFKIPKEVKLKPIKVLHKGKNHDHYFSSGKVFLGEYDGKRYIRVKSDASLSHGRGTSSEHDTKLLGKGDYVFEIQTETDHIKKVKREVID